MRLLGCAIVSLIASNSLLAQSNWTRYEAKDGSFSVVFPKAPIEQTQPLGRNALFPVLNILATKQRDKNDPTYVVMFRSLEPKSKSFDKSLAERQQEIITSAKGNLLEEKEIVLHDQVGREFLFESPKVGLVRCQLFFAEGTLYHLSYFSMTRNRQNLLDADPFFTSFQLKK